MNYEEKYDKKSLLRIFYSRGIIIGISIAIINEYYEIPNQLMDVILYIFFFTSIVIILTMVILSLNGFIYIILKLIFKYNYEKSALARAIEKSLGRVFPKKIYLRGQYGIKIFSDLGKKYSTIYLGILFDILIFSTFLIRIILSKYFINKT